MSDKLIKRLFEHSEHPVTGTMVLTNPDGPAAADEIERLRALVRDAYFEGHHRSAKWSINSDIRHWERSNARAALAKDSQIG